MTEALQESVCLEERWIEMQKRSIDEQPAVVEVVEGQDEPVIEVGKVMRTEQEVD